MRRRKTGADAICIATVFQKNRFKPYDTEDEDENATIAPASAAPSGGSKRRRMVRIVLKPVIYS